MDILSFKEHFKNDFLVYSFVCYAIGFLYQLIYYTVFGIPIIHYVALTDILFFSLHIILVAGVFYIICEYYILTWFIKYILMQVIRVKIFDINRTYFRIAAVVGLIISVLGIELSSRFSINHTLIVALVWIPLLQLVRIRHRINADNQLSFLQIIVLSFTFFFTVIASTKSVMMNSNTKISFECKNKVIETGLRTEMRYLGESSSAIFIYNPHAKSSEVYFKTEISNLSYFNK